MVFAAWGRKSDVREGRHTLGSASKHCQASARTSFSRGVRSSLVAMVMSMLMLYVLCVGGMFT
jgi:hypothetical protein